MVLVHYSRGSSTRLFNMDVSIPSPAQGYLGITTLPLHRIKEPFIEY